MNSYTIRRRKELKLRIGTNFKYFVVDNVVNCVIIKSWNTKRRIIKNEGKRKNIKTF